MNKFWLTVGILVVIEVIGITVFMVVNKKVDFELLNPLVRIEKKETVLKGKRIVGFLPTWMIGKTKIYGGEITDLVFSGVEVKVDGSLVWDVQSKKMNNDNYLKLRESVTKTGGKNILSIKLFKDYDLEKLLDDQTARQKMLTEVRDIVSAAKFDGVNVDFEYMSNPTRILDEDFGLLFEEMKKSGWKEIGVDVFANTIIKGDKDRLNMLAKRVDQIIVMAYDFHRPGSDYAGFVAPIKAEGGQRSISEITQKIVETNLPKEKMILAFPLYGYEWVTVDNMLGSAQVNGGYGRTVQYQESVGFTGTSFDDVAQSPWTVWTEKVQKSIVKRKKVGKVWKKYTTYYTDTEIHQAYFEDERSLKIKIEAAKQAQLGGVGYWALGYEGKESNLISNLKNIISN